MSYGHSDELGPQRLVIAWSGDKPSDEATEALADAMVASGLPSTRNDH